MIKEALEFLANLQTPKNPVTVTVEDQAYGVTKDGTLGEAIMPKAPVDIRAARPKLAVVTLTGLVAAYKAKIDNLGDSVAVIIRDPNNVIVSDLAYDSFGKRQEYVHATHVEERPFPFGKYLEPEDFLLAMRAGFIYTDNAVQLQKLCSTICAGTGVAIADDGISQEVTTKSGTITRASVPLPSDGIDLIPNRIFRDANPVTAKFLLRMRGVKDALPQIALFEIDPNWKLYAVGSIRKYLEGELPGVPIIS